MTDALHLVLLTLRDSSISSISFPKDTSFSVSFRVAYIKSSLLSGTTGHPNILLLFSYSIVLESTSKILGYLMFVYKCEYKYCEKF